MRKSFTAPPMRRRAPGKARLGLDRAGRRGIGISGRPPGSPGTRGRAIGAGWRIGSPDRTRTGPSEGRSCCGRFGASDQHRLSSDGIVQVQHGLPVVRILEFYPDEFTPLL